MGAKLGELISGTICTVLSLFAAYLTLVLFYGIVRWFPTTHSASSYGILSKAAVQEWAASARAFDRVKPCKCSVKRVDVQPN